MFFQIGFAGAQGAEQIAFGRFVHHDVGHDALGLDRLAARRVVARRGQLDAGIWAQRTHGLHRALAKGLGAHDGGALVVLQGARDDLRSRGRAFVDQHHQRHLLDRCGQCLDRIDTTAGVELGRCAESGLALGQLAVGGHHHHIGRQEGGRNGDGGVEQTTGVVAQIEHQALQVRVLLVELVDLAHKVFHRAFLELRDAHPAVTGLHHLGFDRLGLDLGAGDGDGETAAFVLAQDGQRHLGVGLAAHALDRFVQRQAFDGGVVDLGDQVIGFEAGLVSGRALDGRDDADQPVFLRDLDADTDELAAGAFLEFLEGLLVEVLRVRIQARDHARDGIGDQLLVVGWLHVVGLDQAKYGRQLLNFFKRHGRHHAACHGLQRYGGQRASHHAQRNPAGNLQFLAHTQNFL